MPAATRVVLVPPETWDEPRLISAALAIAPPRTPLRAGDDVAGLVVAQVEPQSGLAADAMTVFDLEAKPRASTGPLHVAILVDVAESMALPLVEGRRRLDAARDALLALLRGAPAEWERVSLFTFAKEPRLVAGPFPATALSKGTVDLPEPKGRARTAVALDAALAHLAAEGATGRGEVILLTDSGSDEKALREAAARAKRLGVRVRSFVASPETDPLLDEIARETGGKTEVVA